LGVSYVSSYNKGNRLERGIVAQYTENQNSLANLSNKVLEQAQVPGMMKDDLKEVVKEAIAGRYGNDKTLLAKAITEAYPGQIDAQLYVRIQNTIESGRNDFRAEQTKLIDKVRVYETELGNFFGGTMLSFAGYPKIDLVKYGTIVINDSTAKAFETGRDNGLKLR
jgi:hypothetical protein